MSAFPSVNLVQSAVFNSTGVTMQSGKKLVLSGPATAALEPVSFGQFSDKVSILDVSLNAVKQVIDDVIQDASGSFNSLVELYNISKTIESSGVASLTAETAARQEKDTDLDSRLFTIRNIAPATGVFADANAPSDVPTAYIKNVDQLSQTLITDDGWYFKNDVRGHKAHWYTSPTATVIGDLKAINMPLVLFNGASAPFMTIYTKFQGTDPTDFGVGKRNGASWYHGAYTFIVPPFGSIENPGKYNFRLSIDKVVDGVVVIDDTAPHRGDVQGYTNIDLIISRFNSNVEGNTGRAVIPMDITDEIFACAFGSDSGTAAGKVEFMLTAINYYCSNGNLSCRFSNADVFVRKLKETMNLTP